VTTAVQPVSAGAQQQVRAILEVTEGTTPATDMTVIPHATVTNHLPSTDRSPTANVSSDLKVVDNPRRSIDFSGALTADITHQGADLLLRSGLNRTADATLTGLAAQTDVAGVDSGNKFTSATTDKFNSVTLGVPMFLSGMTTNADGWMVGNSIVTGASPELVVSHYDLADEAATPAVTLAADGYLTESSTFSTLSIEVADTDQGFFRIARGVRVNSIEISGSKGSDPQYTFNWAAISGDSATSTYGTGTNTAATSTTVFDMADNFDLFSVNVAAAGPASSSYLPTEVSLSIKCGDKMIDPAGQLSKASNYLSRFEVTGSFTLLKNTGAHSLINAVDDDTLGNLFWVWTDGTYSTAVFLPAIQYTSVSESGSGNDSPLTLTFNFTAKKHASYGHMIAISKRTLP